MKINKAGKIHKKSMFLLSKEVAANLLIQCSHLLIRLKVCLRKVQEVAMDIVLSD